MRFIRYMIICLPLLTFSAAAQEHSTNQEIRAILEKVHLDSIKQTVRDLTGVDPVNVEGISHRITSRYKTAAGNAIAGKYLAQRLAEYGYQPVVQGFGATGENIYALKTGRLHPEKAYVICAHYDATANYYDKAIGADDNASGCAGVMEAARLLKDAETDYSVMFIFFDEEEQGLIGSAAFTDLFDFDETAIQGVINLDMIAYDNNNDMKADIHARPVAGSLLMSDYVLALNDTFSIGLNLSVTNPGSVASDHASFWNKKIAAVFISEDKFDFHRYYHTIYDSIQYFNDSFFFRNVRLGIASLSWFVMNGELSVSGSSLMKMPPPLVYPNPAEKILYIHVHSAHASVRIHDLQGKLCAAYVLSSGQEQIQLNLPAGVYSLEIKEEERINYSKLIILR
jgi:hypothetical protein